MTKITRMLKIFTFIFVVMTEMAYHRCPICDHDNLVEMDQTLIRPTDEVVCSNEYFEHIRRGRIDIIIHSRLSLQEEPQIIIVAA